MQKTLFLLGFVLTFSVATAQAQVSVNCQDGSCVVTTPCETLTVPGNGSRVVSRSENGNTVYQVFIDGKLVTTCTVEGTPQDNPDFDICELFPFLCN